MSIYIGFGILDEMHSILDFWTSGLQECKVNGFLEIKRVGSSFWSGTKKSKFSEGTTAHAQIFRPREICGGNLMSSKNKLWADILYALTP